MPRSPLIHLPGVAGADEAGRGPLAGPVTAAAVILPDAFDLDGINDSKKLDAKQREALALRIQAEADFAIVFVEPEEIDRLNILRASMAAMVRAVQALSQPPLRIIVDGNRTPEGMPAPCEAIVKGDASHAAIAAASILAKTARDRRMCELAEEYPMYGFDQHFGYPTPDHLDALRRHGPCPIHRRSFGPVRDLLQASLFA